jgi:CYTH domain-containing protein
MPTENERKYVLNPALFPDRMRQHVLGFPCSLIHQGYLFQKKRSNLRIRRCHLGEWDSGEVKFMQTYKRTLPHRVVEIDNPIDERDFNDLWGCCKETLVKARYFVEGWDVDFFVDKANKVYFVLAECEMPEGQDKPDTMPEVVAKSLIYEVPRDDDRFSSRKLADIPYAKKLLQKVLKKANSE